MKKLLFIAVALMAVFTFSQGAMAALNAASDADLCLVCSETGEYEVGKGTAESTCGCDIDLVPCNSQSSCTPFDYDEPYNAAQGSDWCDTTEARCCQVIFDICECGDDPNGTFTSGTTIGIRMTILVNNANGRDLGAYWAEDVSDQIDLGTFGTHAAACGGTLDKGFVNNSFFTDSDCDTAATPYTGTTCAVGTGNRATVIRSTTSGDGFMITDEANPAAPEEFWRIDVPEIRIDPSLIDVCDLISVKIELLDSLGSGICPTCAPICECIYDVAYACCNCGYEPTPETDECCIYFPYVLQGEPGWQSGIAVTNLTFTAGGSWTATFTFTDKNGATYTYNKTFTVGTVAFLMDDLVAEAEWEPAAGAGWLKVEVEVEDATIAIDGYEFNLLEDGSMMFGAGVLARECDWHCSCGAI